MSPAPSLHRHALESVFAFFEPSEMAMVSVVSRDWRAATMSMAPLDWRMRAFDPARMAQICGSPLRRHVDTLDCCNDNVAARSECLQLLSQHMPRLRELSVALQLPLPPGVALEFPAGLRTLDLLLQNEFCAEDEVSACASLADVFAVVGGLAQLEELLLFFDLPPEWESAFSFSPLKRLPRLRFLTLTFSGGAIPRLSDKHIAELRALEQLESFSMAVDAPLLGRLFAEPHSLRWRELGGLWRLIEDMAQLLPRLPLRTVDARLVMPHADFVMQLPHLTALRIGSANREPVDTERIFQAVGKCTQLRELKLQDGIGGNELHFTSALIGACLVRLPNLQRLVIHGATKLETLSFLAQGSLPQSLTELGLRDFSQRLPLAELHHVHQLRELRLFILRNVFDAPLPQSTADELSRFLPRLAHFVCSWRKQDEDDTFL